MNDFKVNLYSFGNSLWFILSKCETGIRCLPAVMRLWKIFDVGLFTKKKTAFCSVCVYDVWMLQRNFGRYLQVTFEAHREDSNSMQTIQSVSVTFWVSLQW